MPEPVPIAVTPVIRGVVVLAVHGHAPADMLMAAVLVQPTAAGDALLEGSVATHPFAWSTVNVCPPIVIVPLRASPTFAPNEKLTVPEPVPLPVTPVIQVVLVLAVHGHNAFDIVMPTLEEPAPAPTDVLADASIAVQPLD